MNYNISKTEEILKEYISKPNTIFVFPTSVAAVSWAERLLEFVPAIAMERFIAWDVFKGDAIRSKQQNRTSIPSVLRKIFAQYLVVYNTKLCKEGKPLFNSIINPVYADQSTSFAGWIASILPALGTWKKHFDKSLLNGNTQTDDSDKDFLVLYNEYKDFLDKYDLFDPAWEEPPFQDNGFEYVIFYPEILSDFCEYEKILRESAHVKIVSVFDGEKQFEQENVPECILYTNSRTELRETTLFIKDLIEQKKCDYNDIVISVPDMENWGSYIMRELDLYCIPAVLRSGKSMSAYGAGRFFSQVQQCVNTKFSFDSVKELLLNAFLPWKDTDAIKLLIQFGIDNSCVCSYESNAEIIDVWQEAFSADSKSLREKNLYTTLKKHCSAMCKVTSFEELQLEYFKFKAALFNEQEFLEESDLVLGRCLTELANLIDIEQSFPDVPVNNHFSFYVSLIGEKEYLPQQKKCGVSVVPYRLSAVAPAYCHIIVGASQSNLTVLFKQLSFLSQSKRDMLSVSDADPSVSFIELYRRHSLGQVRFSCSQKSFSGYSIPHSVFNIKKCLNGLPQNQEECSPFDYYSSELVDFVEKSERTISEKLAITDIQKEGFSNWFKGISCDSDESKNKTDFTSSAEQILKVVQSRKNPEKISVSQTAMVEYYDCPRKWVFKQLLQLKEPEVQAELMQDTLLGTIYHAIISKYLEQYLVSNSYIESPEIDEDGKSVLSKENCEKLFSCVHEVLCEYQASPLTRQLLMVQEKAIYDVVERFLVFFTNQFSKYKIAGLEKKLSCIPTFAQDVNDVEFCGILDCVLEVSPEEFIIIDFKTGGTPAPKNCKPNDDDLLFDFQMPMYVTLWETNDKAESVIGAAFMSIQKLELVPILGDFGSRKKGLQRYSTETEKGFDYTLDCFNNQAKEYINALKNADFKYLESVPFSKCLSCSWKEVCRTNYIVSGDKL